MNIKISSEQELIQICTNALHLLNNLRQSTKDWENEHGVYTKRKKKYFETKTDEFLFRLQIEPHRQSNQIKIVKE